MTTFLAWVGGWFLASVGLCVIVCGMLAIDAERYRASRQRRQYRSPRLDLIDPRIVVIPADEMTDASLHAEADKGELILRREEAA